MANPNGMAEVGERIWRIINQIHPSNSYICAAGTPGECFLVDPGTDTDAIDSALAGLGLKPRWIFCTHGHFDHAGSAAFFQEKYGASCRLHHADLKTLRGSNFLLMAFRVPFTMKLPQVEEAEGFGLTFGTEELRILYTPGHTPGSCIVKYGQALFTGDTLYAHGVGLSKLPGGDNEKLKATLLALWDSFPEGAVVYPGHGDCAPFARIRRENTQLLAFLGLTEHSERKR